MKRQTHPTGTGTGTGTGARRTPLRAGASSRGFSLIEIMVALVIGMIGVLVIMQVARTAEAQKRITTGAGDSQTNAALAMHSAQRDIRQAGYGFNSLNVIGCSLTIPERLSAPLPARTLSVLAPVTINPPTGLVPAGDPGTDTLLIVYGSGISSPEGDTIVSVETFGFARQRIGVTSAANFKEGGWVFVAPPAPENGCALKMEKISEVHAQTIDLPSSDAKEMDYLFDLGVSPKIVAYAVRGGKLTACDYMEADCGENDKGNWPAIADGIVGLRAQYGHDTGSPGNIDVWDRTAPAQPSPPDQEKFACRWARIAAVRLALVARNGNPDREEVTSADPVWAGGAIDLSETDANWKHYRFQVYETVIPLRNIPWMGSCVS